MGGEGEEGGYAREGSENNGIDIVISGCNLQLGCNLRYPHPIISHSLFLIQLVPVPKNLR